LHLGHAGTADGCVRPQRVQTDTPKERSPRSPRGLQAALRSLEPQCQHIFMRASIAGMVCVGDGVQPWPRNLSPCSSVAAADESSAAQPDVGPGTLHVTLLTSSRGVVCLLFSSGSYPALCLFQCLLTTSGFTLVFVLRPNMSRLESLTTMPAQRIDEQRFVIGLDYGTTYTGMHSYSHQNQAFQVTS
jgi:hypothetical protein